MIAIDIKMPPKCDICLFCRSGNKSITDYGYYGECLLQRNKKVNLLNHNRPKECPLAEIKGENKECPYFDYEVGTCRRSETEFDELNNLYYGMTDSMQKAVKDIMLVANGKEIEE